MSMTKKVRFDLSAGAVLLLAALYFFSGAGMLTALLCAAAAHEAGHLLALRRFGCGVSRVWAGACGARIDVYGCMTPGELWCCAAAGPAAGLLFALGASALGRFLGGAWLPTAAGVSLLLSVFNLLPALPLDGGRMLAAVLGPGRTVNAVSFAAALLVLAGGLCLVARGLGAGLFLAGIWLVLAQAGL